MADLIDLHALTPEQIEHLRSVLGTTTQGTRSPMPRPLRDLRMPTTQKGKLNRPHFEWSAEDDGQTVIPPFPRLFWDANGIEIKIHTEDDMIRVQSDWTTAPPMATAITPAERAKAEFDALSPEDQAWVLETQATARRNKMQERMAHLSDADLAAFAKASEVKAEPKQKRSA